VAAASSWGYEDKCHDKGETVVGVVARYHLGAIVMAASKVIDICKDIEEAEVCDIREGLKLVMENDLEPVVAGV
jgi:hypothetical protein